MFLEREWVGPAVLALPTLLVSLDLFVMLLALPQLSADLGAGSTQQFCLWQAVRRHKRFQDTHEEGLWVFRRYLDSAPS